MPSLWLRYLLMVGFRFLPGARGRKKVVWPLAFWRLLQLLSSFGTESPLAGSLIQWVMRVSLAVRGALKVAGSGYTQT